MIRYWIALILTTQVAMADVRINPEHSAISDGWWRLNITLGLDAIVPYRLYTLDQPRRLVVEMDSVSWDGLDPTGILEPGRASAVQLGKTSDGWARLVVSLTQPLAIKQAELAKTDDGASLQLVLTRSSEAAFAEAARAIAADEVNDPNDTVDRFVVAIDPGHGGIDPGAGRDGLFEAPLMLIFAKELATAVQTAGMTPVLTREGDTFVSLTHRITIARDAGADLFISLHADALAEDEARGAAIYTLGSDNQSTVLRGVERHHPDDLLGDLDFTGQGDDVAGVLLDFVRADTAPQSARFADLLVTHLRDNGVLLNNRPRREGAFAVLSAADIPAVLIELGFLSDADDRARLRDPSKRAQMIRAVTTAIAEWHR